MDLIDHRFLSRCAMHPVQLRAHAHASLVEMHHWCLQQRLAQRLHHRRHNGMGLGNGGMHAGRRHRYAKQVLHQASASFHRHMLVLRQIHHCGLDASTILCCLRHPFGIAPRMHMAASAAHTLQPMLNHSRPHGWQINNLTAMRIGCGKTHVKLAAAIWAARRWLVQLYFVGDGYPFQCRSGVSLLPTDTGLAGLAT